MIQKHPKGRIRKKIAEAKTKLQQLDCFNENHIEHKKTLFKKSKEEKL